MRALLLVLAACSSKPTHVPPYLKYVCVSYCKEPSDPGRIPATAAVCAPSADTATSWFPYLDGQDCTPAVCAHDVPVVRCEPGTEYH